MKRNLIIGIAFALVSPFVLAQTTPSTPSTPTAPSDPVKTPTTDDSGMTRGGARTPYGDVNASGNPNSRHVGANTSMNSDFASFDADGDGKLSQDELSSDASLSGRFKDLDKNHDGSVSKAEFAQGTKAKAPKR